MNKKQIIFYSASTPTIMIYKMGRLFKKNGYETFLFAMCEKDRFDYDFYLEAFDNIICSNFQFFKPNIKSLFHLIKKIPSLLKFTVSMKILNPYAVIGICGNNWQLRLVHKYIFKKHPFIYFPYDIISHLYDSREEALKTTKKFEIEAERYCFENSDGIIHKGAPDELDYINERIHRDLKLPKRQLNFLPYCSKEFSVPIDKNKKLNQNKELHVAYVGFFYSNDKTAQKFSNFFKDLSEQKIHVHFYILADHIPKDKEREFILSFFGPITQSEYLHLHKSMGPREIVKEIAKYDLSLWLSHEQFLNELKFCTGHKIASYLEAGLPILHDDSSLFANKLLKDYGVGINFNEKNQKILKNKIFQIDYKKLLRKIEKARLEFDMDENFPRLKEFIERVAKSKKTQ